MQDKDKALLRLATSVPFYATKEGRKRKKLLHVLGGDRDHYLKEYMKKRLEELNKEIYDIGLIY
jgi:hypothetical protein